MGFYRAWFWTKEEKPRIVAHGYGHCLRAGARAMFLPSCCPVDYVKKKRLWLEKEGENGRQFWMVELADGDPVPPRVKIRSRLPRERFAHREKF